MSYTTKQEVTKPIQYNLKSYDTSEKCEKKTIDVLSKLLTQISTICKENKEMFGEKKGKQWYDIFMGNAQKVLIARDVICGTPFDQFVEHYEKHVLTHKDEIDERNEDFFTDEDNEGIYIALDDPDAVQFFRDLWIKKEEEGGFTFEHKSAVWKNLDLIIQLVLKWKTF